MSKVIDYISEHFSAEDGERLCSSAAVANLFKNEESFSEEKIKALIDKVAIFNGIKKREQ